jgi:hypothetical protein
MEGVVPESYDRDQTEQSTTDLYQDYAAQDSSHPTPHDSPAQSPADGAEGSRLSAPLQKRRRVTRACDGTYMSLHVNQRQVY